MVFPDEDSPQALETVFYIIHYRSKSLSKNLSHDALYEIALMAKKYSLEEAISPWMYVWLRNRAGGGGKALFVMNLFEDREGFRNECQRIILQSEGYDHNDDQEREKENDWDSNLVPTKVLGKI